MDIGQPFANGHASTRHDYLEKKLDSDMSYRSMQYNITATVTFEWKHYFLHLKRNSGAILACVQTPLPCEQRPFDLPSKSGDHLLQRAHFLPPVTLSNFAIGYLLRSLFIPYFYMHQLFYVAYCLGQSAILPRWVRVTIDSETTDELCRILSDILWS